MAVTESALTNPIKIGSHLLPQTKDGMLTSAMAVYDEVRQQSVQETLDELAANGGGGSGDDAVKDVKVNGTSVVDVNGEANITAVKGVKVNGSSVVDSNGEAIISVPVKGVKVEGNSVVDNNGDANITFPVKGVKVNGASVIDNNGDANITVPSIAGLATETYVDEAVAAEAEARHQDVQPLQSSISSEVSRAQAKEAELQETVDDIDEEVFGKHIKQPDTIVQGSINAEGKMSYPSTMTAHCVVAVDKFVGEQISASEAVQYAFLSSYTPVLNEYSTFCQGCGRETGRPVNAEIPADCQYLYLMIGNLSTATLPAVSVTGETTSMSTTIQQLSDDVASKVGVETITTAEQVVVDKTITPSSPFLEDKMGYYANNTGWHTDANYRSKYYTATKDNSIYVNCNISEAFDLVIFNGEVNTSNFVARYRYTDSTLPTIDNKLSIVAGQTVVISTKKIDWQLGEVAQETQYQFSDNVIIPDMSTASMYAEKTATQMNVYVKNSKGRFIKYPFNYRYKAYNPDNYNNFKDNWGVGIVTEAAYENGVFVDKCVLFRKGEAEQAVQVPNGNGRTENNGKNYVGGDAHGYENIVTTDGKRHFRLMIDGVEFAEDSTFTLRKVLDIRVYQHTQLCQAYTNTSPFLDTVKTWVFSPAGLSITTSSTFLREIYVYNCQQGMLCPLRRQDEDTSKPYITNRGIKNTEPFKVYNLEDGWSDTSISQPQNCNSIEEYGELGYSFKMTISNENRKTNGGMFVGTNSGLQYNKIYYDAGRDFVSEVNEQIHATQTWTIN